MLRMQRLCLVVAFLSTTVSAWNFQQVFGSTRRTATSSTLSPATTCLTMTAMRRKTKSSSAEFESSPSKKVEKQFDSSILDDGQGHINADLASSLWNWDYQHRESARLPKLSLSTRQGLRLVHDVVDEISASPRGKRLLRGGDFRTDLIQEGIIALMDVLNEYRLSADAITLDDDPTADPNKQFQAYARPYLEDRLWSTLDRSARPLQLPETESTLWRHVQLIRPQLQKELGGRQPTVRELAERLEMPTETLELLMATRRNSLSVESTVEIMTPSNIVDTAPSFTDQDQWDSREGHYLLDAEDGTLKEEILVEEYQDEMYQYEGEDEMWLHQTQVAAPLRELIPDVAPSPDDVAVSEMIRHDVGEFLTKTLTPQEVLVVRMAFGLDSGKKTVWEEISLALSMSDENATDMAQLMPVEDVKKILKGALKKLRVYYRHKYVEYMDEDEQDYFSEDSV